MRETTVGNVHAIVNSVQSQFIGIPSGLFCRADVIIDILKLSAVTWRLWKAAGMKVESSLGTKAEFVFTDEVIAFIRSKPKIGERKRYKPKCKKSA